MVGQFKGDPFITLDKGIQAEIPHHIEYPAGKIIIDNDFPVYEGKTYYDPEFNFIEDNTIVDGCRLQDERYWAGYPVGEWLQTEPLEMPDDLCVIGFRGGEYYTDPSLGLPLDYYQYGITEMWKKGITKFEVHTDDPEMAKTLFPYPVTHEVGINWRSVRYAKHAIIANSAFYILPRLLNGGDTVAPRYWARRNIKEWSTPQNYYSRFQYL